MVWPIGLDLVIWGGTIWYSMVLVWEYPGNQRVMMRFQCIGGDILYLRTKIIKKLEINTLGVLCWVGLI